jgi:ElaA protein
MTFNYLICSFNELNIHQLYALLKLRQDVFVLEQNCVYPDLDEKDQKATHVLQYINGDLSGYARLFHPGDYFDNASIGRVVVSMKYRNTGAGFHLMKTCVEHQTNVFKHYTIDISAQAYLQKFYESLGFKITGEGYLEDGIPHNPMRYAHG